MKLSIGFSRNQTFAEFRNLVRAALRKKVGNLDDLNTIEREYRGIVGFQRTEARPFATGKLAKELGKGCRAPSWASWLAQAALGDFELESKAAVIHEGTLHSLSKGDGSIEHAYLVHYRFHMYANEFDLRFADRIDNFVFGVPIRRMGEPVFGKPNANKNKNKEVTSDFRALRNRSKKANKTNHKPEVSDYLTLPSIGSPNHFSAERVTLVGRSDERRKLKRFLSADKKYAWLQLAGPAGQGKSRLAFDIAKTSIEAGWHAGWVETSEIKHLAKTSLVAEAKKPTLIIVDYILTKTTPLRRIMRELWRQHPQFKCKVRLLLVERESWMKDAPKDEEGLPSFFQSIQHRALWFTKLGERYDGNDAYLQKSKFEDGSLQLSPLSIPNLAKIVTQVIEQAPGISIPSEQIENALRKTDVKGRPLYAIFLGDAILNGSYHPSWTKIDLLKDAISRDQRTRWVSEFRGFPPEIGNTKNRAMAIALLSTILREISSTELMTALGWKKSMAQHERRHIY